MRRVIITERQPAPFPGHSVYSAVFWVAVPAGSELPAPTFNSRLTGSPYEPNTTELAALRAGQLKEYVTTFTFHNGMTESEIATYLQACWSQATAAFLPPGKYYGVGWDGTASGWTRTIAP